MPISTANRFQLFQSVHSQKAKRLIGGAATDIFRIFFCITSRERQHTVLEEEANRPPTQEEIAAEKLAAIDTRLEAIDRESVRPLRAMRDGGGTDEDRAKLAALEQEAGALRPGRINRKEA